MKSLMEPFDIAHAHTPSRLGVPVGVAGAGATSAWFTLFHTRVEPAAGVDAAASEIALDLVIILTCVACTLFARRRGGLACKPPLVCLACGAAVLGTLLLVPGMHAKPALFYIGAALAMAGTTALLLMWKEYFSCLSPARTALYVSCAILAGEALRIALLGLVPAYFYIALALLPVLSTATLVHVFRSVPDADRPAGKAVAPHMPAWLLVAVTAYALCYGLVAKTGASSVVVTSLSKVLPALLIIATLLLQSERFTFNDVYRLGMPLAVCGGALSCAFTGMDPAIANFFVTFGFMTCRVLVTVGLGAAVRTAGGGAAYLFGIQVGAQYGASLIGKVAQFGCSNAVPEGAWAVIVLAACLVAATSALFMMRDKARMAFVWGIPDPDAEQEGPDATAALAIQHAAEKYGLSEREVEVLRLLLEGQTLGQIGRDLCIAEGTVKSHTSRIYRKMGIAGRAQIKDVLAGDPGMEKAPR